MKKLIFILFVIFNFSLSFAECESVNSVVGTYSGYVYQSSGLSSCLNGGCDYQCSSCQESYSINGWIYTNIQKTDLDCPSSFGAGCGGVWCGHMSGNCRATLRCRNQCDLDSIQCVNAGKSWDYIDGATTCGGKGCKTCDTTMNCISYPFNRCVDVPAASLITCVNGQCSGLPSAMFYSEFRIECRNECGDVETRSVTSDTAYIVGGSCDDDVNCGSEIFCGEFGNGTYFLYKKCFAGRESVGNVTTQRAFAQIEYSGRGRCAENGYTSSKYAHDGQFGFNEGGAGSGSQGSDDEQSVNDDCVLYGIGCENYTDSTDYSNPDNQSPTKNCWCEPFDGANTVSRIVCPDGTSRIVYFSCKDWHDIFSSSSSAPPSSGSAGGGGSSGGSTSTSSDSNPFQGKYPTYPTDQPTTNKNVQGALSGMGNLLTDIKNKLIEIKNYLTSNENETYIFDSVSLSHGDYSSLDSIQYPHLSFDSLFNIIDTSYKVIDSSKYVGVGTCPIINGRFSACKYIPFFRGNTDLDMKFDFSDFWGFNLCTLIKSLVLGFASIVSSLISIKLFLKSGL